MSRFYVFLFLLLSISPLMNVPIPVLQMDDTTDVVHHEKFSLYAAQYPVFTCYEGNFREYTNPPDEGGLGYYEFVEGSIRVNITKIRAEYLNLTEDRLIPLNMTALFKLNGRILYKGTLDKILLQVAVTNPENFTTFYVEMRDLNYSIYKNNILVIYDVQFDLVYTWRFVFVGDYVVTHEPDLMDYILGIGSMIGIILIYSSKRISRTIHTLHGQCKEIRVNDE